MQTRFRRFIYLSAAAALLAAPAVLANSESAASEWRFRVLLDGKEIGFHDYRVSQGTSQQVIDSDARFDVKFLFFNAFSYRHQNQEIWSGDCLSQLDAQTDSNGKQTRVTGQRNEDQFLLQINEDSAQLPHCVKTFAYWNPAIVDATRLLNVQTGQLEAVSTSLVGSASVQHEGSAIDALRYRLVTDKGDISLWYDAVDGRWLALEAPAKGGRTIRYEPLSLPPATSERLSGRVTQRSGSEG